MNIAPKNNKCKSDSINYELVNEVAQSMPVSNNIEEISSFFKVCGDPTRLKILFALFTKEMCVCDIAELLGMSLSSISHQLRVLKQTRMVSSRKEGQHVYYNASDLHVKKILDQAEKHITE